MKSFIDANPLQAPKAKDVLITVIFAFIAGGYSYFAGLELGFHYPFWFTIGWLVPIDLGVSRKRYGFIAYAVSLLVGITLCGLVNVLANS